MLSLQFRTSIPKKMGGCVKDFVIAPVTEQVTKCFTKHYETAKSTTHTHKKEQNKAQKSVQSHIRWSKTNLKKCVLSCFLKSSVDAAEHRFMEGEFQRVGTTTSNARSPLVFSLTRGTTRGPWSEDLRGLLGMEGWSRSEIIRCLIMQGFINKNKNLKINSKFNGSQCKKYKIGVIWANLLDRVHSLASAFCTSCKLSSQDLLRQVRRALP